MLCTHFRRAAVAALGARFERLDQLLLTGDAGEVIDAEVAEGAAGSDRSDMRSTDGKWAWRNRGSSRMPKVRLAKLRLLEKTDPKAFQIFRGPDLIGLEGQFANSALEAEALANTVACGFRFSSDREVKQ